MIAMAAGTAASAYGQYKTGQGQQEIANANASIDQQKATQAQQIGSIQSNQQVLRTRQIIGAQTAAMGASGGVVDTGSSSQILNDTQMSGTTNANIAANNSMQQAWGYDTQAGMERAQGAFSAQSGEWGATSTLLTGAASVYGMGNKYYGWGAKS
jgi:hypothetical protein